MLNTPAILGISMAPQKNRRLLVAVTYTIFVAFEGILLMMPSWVHELGPLGRQFFDLAGMMLILVPRWYWFPKLTKVTPLGGRPTSVEITRLGLTPGPHDPYDPDEREVAIRNAAYAQAFRFIIILRIRPFRNFHVLGPSESCHRRQSDGVPSAFTVFGGFVAPAGHHPLDGT